MKVAIIGYGKMGKTIEGILIENGHEVVLRSTSSQPTDRKSLRNADVAIEFTEPRSAVSNILLCFEEGVAVVTGTTGWYDELPLIVRSAENAGLGFFHASNFSLGVNLFDSIIRAAARLMKNFENYRPSIREIHHLQKKDAPSGTALTLAQTLIDEYQEIEGWSTDKTNHDALYIEAIREGEVRGTHEIHFEGSEDKITLTHEAFSREGFARGAVAAAEWLIGRKGVFTMKDMLNTMTL